MKRIAVIVLVFLVALGGLLAFAAANLNSYLNNNKEALAARVSGVLGRPVSFESIAVSLAGGLSVDVGDLAIGDDPAYSDSDFVRAAGVSVRIKLLPALFGRYEVKRIALQRPDIVLIRDAAGFNADSLGAGRGEADEEPGEAGAGAALVIALFDIAGGRLELIDRSSRPPSTFTIEDLDVSASGLRPDTALDFVVAARVLGSDSINLRAHGNVGPLNPADSAATPLDVNLSLDPIDGADLSNLGSLVTMPEELSMSGPLTVELRAVGTLAELQAEAEVDTSGAAVTYGSAFSKARDVRMAVAVEAQRYSDMIAIRKLDMEAAGARITGQGTIGVGENASYKVALTGSGVGLSGWDRMFPALEGMRLSGKTDVDLSASGARGGGAPVLTGTLALDGAGVRRAGMPAVEGLSTTVTFTQKSITMAPADFKLAGSPARLSARVDDLDDPALRCSLTAAELYPAAFGAGAVRPRRKEVIRGLELDGILRQGESGARFAGQVRSVSGTLRNYDYRELNASVRYQDGRATLAPMSLQAYGGALSGSGHYDITDADNPRFAMDLEGTDIRLGDLVTAQTGGAEGVVEGLLDLSVSVAGSGKEWVSIRNALNGNGSFGLRDGAIKDVNLAEGVLQGITGVPGLSSLLSEDLRRDYPGLFTTGDTHFEDLRAGFRMVAGRMITDDVVLKATDYIVRGKGSIGLDQSVDVAAEFIAGDGLNQALMKKVGELRYLTGGSGRIEIPFGLEGKLPGARPKVDQKFVQRALGRAIVGGLVEQLLGPSGGSNADDTGSPANADSSSPGNADSGSNQGDGQRGGTLFDLLGLPPPPDSNFR